MNYKLKEGSDQGAPPRTAAASASTPTVSHCMAGEWGAGPLTPGCPLGWRREGPNQGPLHLADPSTMGQGCFTWGRRGDRQARWDSPSDSEAALKIR